MSKKVTVFVVLGLVALTLIGTFVYDSYKDYLHKNPDGTRGNTAVNLNNGGYVCQVGDTVYFANAFDNGRLYEMKTNESGMRKIVDQPVSNINVDDKYVYYYVSDVSALSGLGGFSMPTLGLFRTDIKTKRTKQLDRITCGVVMLADNDLYYQRYDNDAGVHLQAYNIRSNESVVALDEAINPACMVVNRIYYSGITSDHYLHCRDLSNGSDTVVLKTNVWNPVYQGHYIYFMNIDDDYKLYRYESAKDSLEQISSYRVDGFVVTDNAVIYQQNDPLNPALIKASLDGSNPVELAKGNYAQLSVTSDMFYCVEFGVKNIMYHMPLGGNKIEVFSAAQNAAQ